MGTTINNNATMNRAANANLQPVTPRANVANAQVTNRSTAAQFRDSFEMAPKANANMPVLTPDDTTKQFPPIPEDLKKNGGLSRDGLPILEAGIERGGYELGLAWMQELHGLKVDGQFGMGSYKAMSDNPAVIQALRDARIAATPNAKTTPLSPMTPAQKQKLMDDLTNIRDSKPDVMVGYEAAVTALQTRMVKSGEPMMIDGKLGKGTYESMVRLYGQKTADELSKHLMMLKTTEGDM